MPSMDSYGPQQSYAWSELKLDMWADEMEYKSTEFIEKTITHLESLSEDEKKGTLADAQISRLKYILHK